ncbi:HNH endonuclease domain-containing protein [Ruminococcus albus]|uniref:HNH endonuclease domain-containing protein n=1 Tax=Ruminococcus albus TaxID=1264 RepID=UPI001D1334EB|nr:hypothetical protein [Ruminococcus albus 8]
MKTNFEVDHIVPYSLILDNTINNKALVYAEENQKKGQRTPLMYMNEAQAADYRVRVNTMFKSKKCSKKKYQYLMLPDLNDQEYWVDGGAVISMIQDIFANT